MRWGTAFKYAFKAVLAALLFEVVGGLLLVFAAMFIMASFMRPGNIVAAFVCGILGFIIYSLGLLAVWFKYLPEATADELKLREGKKEQT